MSGSFHFLFFGQSDQKTEKIMLFIFYKKNPQTANFFVFQSLWPIMAKNKKWNERDKSQFYRKIRPELMIWNQLAAHPLLPRFDHENPTDFDSSPYLTTNVGFIPFFVFHFLVKVTKTEKISCQFYSSLKRFHFAQKRSRFSYK